MTNPQRGLPSGIGMWLAAAITLLTLMGLWGAAMAQTQASTAPTLMVIGARAVQRGAPFPVLVMVYDEERRKTFPLDGQVAWGNSPWVQVERGLVRFPAMPVNDTAVMRFSAREPNLSLALSVEVLTAPSPSTSAGPRFTPWPTELWNPSAADLSAAPFYPMSGRVRSTLSTLVFLLEQEGPTMQLLKPNAAGIRLPDGRQVRLDRSGVVLGAPVTATPGEEMTLRVEVLEPGTYLAVVGVGQEIVEFRWLDLSNGASSHEFRIPDEARVGDFFSVQIVRSPLSRSDPAVARTIITSPQIHHTDLDALMSTEPFSQVQDPLMSWLRQHPESESPELLQAVLGRLQEGVPTWAHLGPSSSVQRQDAWRRRVDRVSQYRLPFRIAAGLFAALVVIAAWRSARENRRLAHALSGEETGTRKRPQGWLPLIVAVLSLTAALSLILVLDLALHLEVNRVP